MSLSSEIHKMIATTKNLQCIITKYKISLISLSGMYMYIYFLLTKFEVHTVQCKLRTEFFPCAP